MPTRDESGESCDELWKTLPKCDFDTSSFANSDLKIRVKTRKFNDIVPIRICSITDAGQI